MTHPLACHSVLRQCFFGFGTPPNVSKSLRLLLLPGNRGFSRISGCSLSHLSRALCALGLGFRFVGKCQCQLQRPKPKLTFRSVGFFFESLQPVKVQVISPNVVEIWEAAVRTPPLRSAARKLKRLDPTQKPGLDHVPHVPDPRCDFLDGQQRDAGHER